MKKFFATLLACMLTASICRCIVKIVEFSATPDQNLLRLPAGLVDATKRKR